MNSSNCYSAQQHPLKGFGKIILLGEHAVVYGFPAIAMGLESGIEAKIESCGSPFVVKIDEWNLTIDHKQDTPHGRALSLMLDYFNISHPEGISIKIKPNIPPRAGLGASAAMAVAVAKALAYYSGRILSDKELFEAAQISEKIFHLNPSGLDVSAAIFGGLFWFIKDVGVSIINAPSPKILIVYSGEPKDTGAAVARFAASLSKSSASASNRLDQIGTIVTQGKQALEAQDYTSLGSLMTRNHELLCSFDVSSPALNRIVELAIKEGALGAKMTGGGCGGCAVVLPGNREKAIKDTLIAEGYVTVDR